jgi:antitoxin component of RelBE/YafQ-DinJ toxin-antitoxin module
MTIVNTMATVKDDRIYVRVSSNIKLDFELVAAYRGLTPSAMLHSFIVKTIHEARQESPQIFERGKEENNQTPETEKLDKAMTLNEAKADDKKKKKGNKK